MATKKDDLDLELPAAILDLGQAIPAMHGGVRPRTHPAHQEQMAAVEERVLAMAKGDANARKLIGIRERGQGNEDRRMRLRAFAYLAHKMLKEPMHSNADMAEVAVAVMDPRLAPGEALIVARHAIGRMVAECVLDAYPDGQFPWNPRVLLPARALQWVAGGRSSLGILSPQRLAAVRLKGRDEQGTEMDGPAPEPLSARQIRDKIAKRVVGLEDGGQLDVVSSRLALHMVRAKMLASGEDPGTPNEVVLVLGESGTGKTWLCEQAGQATGLPYASANAAEMSASGYVGISCEDGLRPLLVAAKGRVEACRFGLMCYDEFTKRGASVTESAVNSTCVQNEMLRLVQGQVTQVGGKRSNHEPSYWINTHGMFFFLCGHAPGLERLIQRRMGRRAIGFAGGERPKGNRALLHAALEDYGIIPEMINRMTEILIIKPPGLKELVRASTSENGVIAAYGRLLGDAMLIFEDGAVLSMARHCLATKMYYRGLAAITSAIAAEAITREQKGAVMVTASDVQRAMARMDNGVADLLGTSRRAGLHSDPMPEEGTTDTGSGTGLEAE